MLKNTFAAEKERIGAAVVAASIAYIAAAYFGQLITYSADNNQLTTLPIVFGLVGWIVFLMLVHHKK